MKRSIDAAITQLILKAFDKAKVTDAEWRQALKIAPARLGKLRAGRSNLSDADLDRVAQATGEPWESLVLRVLGNDSTMTAQARELIESLHLLKCTASIEASDHIRHEKRPTLRDRFREASSSRRRTLRA